MQIMQNLRFYHKTFLFRITEGVHPQIYCSHGRNTLYKVKKGPQVKTYLNINVLGRVG